MVLYLKSEKARVLTPVRGLVDINVSEKHVWLLVILQPHS